MSFQSFYCFEASLIPTLSFFFPLELKSSKYLLQHLTNVSAYPIQLPYSFDWNLSDTRYILLVLTCWIYFCFFANLSNLRKKKDYCLLWCFILFSRMYIICTTIQSLLWLPCKKCCRRNNFRIMTLTAFLFHPIEFAFPDCIS